MYVNTLRLIQHMGHAAGGAVVEVLCYKPEGAGSIPNGVIGNFHGHNPFGRTLTLESN
jgi:hypothetical protein